MMRTPAARDLSGGCLPVSNPPTPDRTARLELATRRFGTSAQGWCQGAPLRDPLRNCGYQIDGGVRSAVDVVIEVLVVRKYQVGLAALALHGDPRCIWSRSVHDDLEKGARRVLLEISGGGLDRAVARVKSAHPRSMSKRPERVGRDFHIEQTVFGLVHTMPAARDSGRSVSACGVRVGRRIG